MLNRVAQLLDDNCASPHEQAKPSGVSPITCFVIYFMQLDARQVHALQLNTTAHLGIDCTNRGSKL